MIVLGAPCPCSIQTDALPAAHTYNHRYTAYASGHKPRNAGHAGPGRFMCDPTRPDPTRPDPTRPDPTLRLLLVFGALVAELELGELLGEAGVGAAGADLLE